MVRASFFSRTRLRYFLVRTFASALVCGAAASVQATTGTLTMTGINQWAAIAGRPYTFTPTVSNPSGRALRFAIVNKPSWATLNTSTGQLSGTPPNIIQTYSNISMSVTDGLTTARANFSIRVYAPNTWDKPMIAGTPVTTVAAGGAYAFQPSARDAYGQPLTFSVTNKPTWASFSAATGRLSGTPTSAQAGTYGNVQISVTNGELVAALPAFSIKVTGATTVVKAALSLSASPGNVSRGVASTLSWSSTNATSCTASGGWSGSKGMSGSWSTGAMSATTSYTLTCSGASGTTPAAATATVAVSGGSGGSLSIISPATLPSATNGGGYFYLLQASGGTPPYRWSLSSHSGATGWVVTPDGWLEGAPTGNESDSIVATVTDSASHSAQGSFAVTVNSNLAVMGQNFVKGGITLPPAMAGAAYSHVLQAAGGSSPYSWSIASGSLPAGLALSSAGVITGTPSASGSISGIVFRVMDNTNATATANGSLTVAAANKGARPAYNTGSGFFVSRGQLYDANGNVFRIRGADRAHYDNPDQPGISKSGANTVRFFMYNIGVSGAPGASTYATSVALQQHINYHELPIITAANVAGVSTAISGDNSATDLATTVSWWVNNVGAFAPIMNQMAINIANEWGPSNSSVWASSYETAIARLRAAGYTCPLVIDTGGSGEDFGDLLNYATQVFNSDPQKNLIFSLHLYYNSASAFAGNVLPQLASLSASQGMAFIIGEFGPGRNIGPAPTPVTPGQIIQASEAAGLGWIAWAWDDNDQANCSSSNNWFSMTYHCGTYTAPSDLTWFGLDVTLNPAYGLGALASPPAAFLP